MADEDDEFIKNAAKAAGVALLGELVDQARQTIGEVGTRVRKHVSGEAQMRHRKPRAVKRTEEDIVIDAREAAINILVSTEDAAFDPDGEIGDIGKHLEQLASLNDEWQALDE